MKDIEDLNLNLKWSFGSVEMRLTPLPLKTRDWRCDGSCRVVVVVVVVVVVERPTLTDTSEVFGCEFQPISKERARGE
jgi:hypothetical protein